MAFHLHTCLLKEQTATNNLCLASEIKVEACLLLAECAELVPKDNCRSWQRFKGMLSHLCDYCQEVCASGGLLPTTGFAFKDATLHDAGLAEIKDAFKVLWQEAEGQQKFQVFRNMDTATDFCFQLAARLAWGTASHVGCRMQQVLGCDVRWDQPPGIVIDPQDGWVPYTLKHHDGWIPKK